MFSQLIASRPARAQGAEGTTASLVLHGLIITAAIIATAKGPAVLEAPRESRIVPLTAPVAPAAPQAAPPRAAVPRAPVVPRTPAAAIPVEVPPIAAPSEIPSTIPAPGEATPFEAGTPIQGTPGTGAPSEGSPIGTGTTLGAESVDVAARLLPSSPLPRFPDLLRSRGLEGYARVRFVVGANGRAELETLEVLDATHPAFAEAVRAVLPRLRFAPARLGDERVRQLVEIPFGFALTSRR
jgi:periplasmic protein TonB